MSTIKCENTNGPTIHNISIYKGDTYIGFDFQCLVNDLPFDLTGCTIKSEIREKTKTGAVVDTREIGTGITIVDLVNGDATYDKLKWIWGPGTFYYDIEVIDPLTDVRTFVAGVYCITQDVTNNG